jgi:hypothetical protein
MTPLASGPLSAARRRAVRRGDPAHGTGKILKTCLREDFKGYRLPMA